MDKKISPTLLGVLSVNEWRAMFDKIMKFEVDLDELYIPPKPEGDWWSIIVPPGLTYGYLEVILHNNFFRTYTRAGMGDVELMIDLEKEQRRAFERPYLIWVPANVEADADMADKSADDLVGVKTITLLERILLEWVFYLITDGHLETNAVTSTLCAGSRCRDGKVPVASWYGSELLIGSEPSSGPINKKLYNADRARCVFDGKPAV